ncbi:MAG TPA: hypothetical protein PKC21_08105 [Oligoflexia bacterium]|nr:hypothetical protein [Oligoflexia bacterium]HMR25301.1 hypothetical protein [Oligoflexia bacterium]
MNLGQEYYIGSDSILEDENNNPYIKAIIANFVGEPLNDVSEHYILEKLADPQYPVHIKYELLKNIVDAQKQPELPKDLGKSLLLKHFLLSKYKNKGIVLEK